MNFDLSDPKLLLRADVLADPRPLYDHMRREAPVWRIPGQDSYLVTDPALIREAVGRTGEFSSNLISVLHTDDGGELCAYGISRFGDPVNTLATADPPVHTRHRKLLQPHFSSAAVSRLAPALARIADEQLAPLLSEGRGDFVSGFSDSVPARAICEVIGLPQSDAAHLIELVGGIAAMLDGVTGYDGMSQAASATLDLLAYAQEKLEAGIHGPPDGRTALLAALVDAIGSGVVTPDEAHYLVVLLINAGTETTSSLISAAVKMLATSPELQDHLRANPADIPDAIEDFLRDQGPFQFHYRWTTTEVMLGEHHLPAHSRVLLMWAAANRPSPEETRETSTESDDRDQAHFAFGRGPHFCIGAHLARLEGRIALERLLAQTSAFALDPEASPALRPSIFLRRHARLPLLVEKA